MRARAVMALGGVAALLSSCAPSTMLRGVVFPSSPHEQYAQSLRQTGLDRTALGRDWLFAADRALQTTLSITLPYRETGYFAPEEAGAVAYRFGARRGQRLRIEVELETSEPGRLFLDLFCRGPGSDTLKLVTSAPVETSRLEYEVTHDGTYVVRLQPELLRGGRYSLTQQALASLRFPVLGKDSRAVSSGFGAARDGGQREHHGIDILAPRGTPVLSAADGVVTSVGVTDIGGKVVWVSDPARDLSLYYAHLDSQGVSTGTRVRTGDVLGTVGNTGNARATVPHLHFGIYHRHEGPIDPIPYVHETPAPPPAPAAGASVLGSWRRVDESAVRLLSSPASRSAAVVDLPRNTVVRVQGVAAQWYRVRLPDARTGFVPAAMTRSADTPLQSARRAVVSPIRDRPDLAAATLGYVAPDHPVPVLGSFQDYLLVRADSGRIGWLASEPIDGNLQPTSDPGERAPRVP
jgi:murein DD-endopeptidase MepM/ murein hydrolase activator NlpD/SH3-like domain-containing protein